MTFKTLASFVLITIFSAGCALRYPRMKPGTDGIILDSPQFGPALHSPFTIHGYAPGDYMFEGSMPVMLKDSTGKVIAQGLVQAEGEWTTLKYVGFKGTLTFDPPETNTGSLIIQKDNPSGLSTHIIYFSMAVLFRVESFQ